MENDHHQQVVVPSIMLIKHRKANALLSLLMLS